MIVLSSDEGDVVFDPFAGSGAVVTGAIQEGRRGLGIELNPEYVSEFRTSVHAVRREKSDSNPVSAMTQRLLELRMLKYPKELAKQILRGGFTTSQVRAVLMEVESTNYKPARTGYGTIHCSVVVAEELSEIETARLSKLVQDVIGKAPLSKYGLKVRWTVVSIAEAGVKFEGSEVSIYTRGRTWHADKTLAGAQLGNWIRKAGAPSVVPIVSPLHVTQSLEESI